MDTKAIAYELFKEMDIADLDITYNILRGKNFWLKKKVRAYLQKGPRSTSEIKNWLNGSDEKKKGRMRLRYGAITQQLSNILGKNLDVKKIGLMVRTRHTVAGSYNVNVWILTQHLEFIDLFQKRLESYNSIVEVSAITTTKWGLAEWAAGLQKV